ncbi:MAG: DUF177 domain-containing protein [Bacteroidota bacterium]|nr:DUF177 domain-containing protein [Bacteroidota bacterium]
METKNFFIKVSRLSEGENHAQFELNDDFFVSNGSNFISNSKLIADVEINKLEATGRLNFHIHGTIDVDCDVCNRSIGLPLDFTQNAIMKISDSVSEESKDNEEIIYLRKSEDLVYLDELIYDFVLISIPMKKSCDIDGVVKNCDDEMLKKLENLSHDNEDTDDRWDDLKNLKFDN